MIKNECDIVRDLFPNYIENQVNDGTKEFVDNHLKECKNCAKLLDSIKKEDSKEDTQNDEIDYLMKYSRKIMTTKIIIIILACLIMFPAGILIFKYITVYQSSKQVYDIINEAYAKTEEFMNKSNYKFTLNNNDDNINTYYFKDNKFKGEYLNPSKHFRRGSTSDRMYGKQKDEGYVYVGFSDEYKSTSSAMNTEKGKFFEQYEYYFKDLKRLKNNTVLQCNNIEIIEDKYNNIDCYILEEHYKNSDLIKFYIDKSNMLLIRYEETSEKSEDTIEYFIDFGYEVGKITEDDVKLKDIEGYTIFPDYNNYLEEIMN